MRIDPGPQKAPGGGIPVDRRRSPRYGLRLAMSIVTIDGHAVSIPARTRNVSRDGVLVETSARLSPGQDVEYVIELYPEYALQMRCRGRVHRRMLAPGERGNALAVEAWALTIESMEYSWRSAAHVAARLGCGPLVAI